MRFRVSSVRLISHVLEAHVNALYLLEQVVYVTPIRHHPRSARSVQHVHNLELVEARSVSKIVRDNKLAHAHLHLYVFHFKVVVECVFKHVHPMPIVHTPTTSVYPTMYTPQTFVLHVHNVDKAHPKSIFRNLLYLPCLNGFEPTCQETSR